MPSKDSSKEKNEVQKRVKTQDQKPVEKKNGHTYSTGYDQLKSENDMSIPNGQTIKFNYEKLNIVDNADIALANIVIESDPDDSNRYFRKTDMGDWYRLIMKKKRPKDTEKLLDKTTNDKGDKDTKHKRNRESAGDNDGHKHRSRSRDKGDHRKHSSHSTDKRQHRSSGHELSSTLPKSTDAKATSKERLSASLPMQSSSTKGQSVNNSSVKQSAAPPSRVIMSRPLSVSNSRSASLENPKTVGTKESQVTKETSLSQVPAVRPRVIMSQPKPDTETKDPKLPSQKRPENVPRLNLPK